MCLFACGSAVAEQGPPDLLPTLGSIERLDPRFDALVPRDAVIEVLAGGFEWAEGPVWLEGEQAVLFSDIPRNRVMRFRDGEGVGVFLEPAGFTGPGAYGSERGSNGLTLDRQGHLISCEHGDRRVSRLTPGGGKRTVADNYRGKRFNSPNDCVVHSSGAIYFTDPPYGLPKGWSDERRELDFINEAAGRPDSERLCAEARKRPLPGTGRSSGNDFLGPGRLGPQLTSRSSAGQSSRKRRKCHWPGYRLRWLLERRTSHGKNSRPLQYERASHAPR
jgi:hypothetical protein